MGTARYAAYLRAYDLFEAVQGEDHDRAAAELRIASAAADEQDWPEVSFVLAGADAVHRLARPAEPELTKQVIESLVWRAEGLRQPAFLAIALGLRAVVFSAAGNTAGLLADAARAVALLDEESASPLDRSMAYLIAAAAYNSLSLWELVDELYSRAIDLGPSEGEAAKHLAAVLVNRVLIRLEWALALIQQGELEQSDELQCAAMQAVPHALRAQLRPLWRRDVLTCQDILRLLQAAPEADVEDVFETLATHRKELIETGDVEVLPMLDAVVALVRWQRGELAAGLAAASALSLASSSTSGARTFPAWVRARVFAENEPSAGIQAQQDYSELVARLLWQSRDMTLAAARAQIAVERRRAEHDRLARDVHTDTLTGLLNRRTFEAWLQQQPELSNETTALLLVDIDEFKSINDNYGHDCGDEVLRRIGQLIRSFTRSTDLAVRQGGDEFALILQGHDLVAATVSERARWLWDAVDNAPWSDLAEGLGVRVSIGFALGQLKSATGSGEAIPWDAGRLYRAADEALYRAKRSQTGISEAG
ncbi:MAG TPA: GGDEF domain-containing protein [Jatrophihabitans sp.]